MAIIMAITFCKPSITHPFSSLWDLHRHYIWFLQPPQPSAAWLPISAPGYRIPILGFKTSKAQKKLWEFSICYFRRYRARPRSYTFQGKSENLGNVPGLPGLEWFHFGCGWGGRVSHLEIDVFSPETVWTWHFQGWTYQMSGEIWRKKLPMSEKMSKFVPCRSMW